MYGSLSTYNMKSYSKSPRILYNISPRNADVQPFQAYHTSPYDIDMQYKNEWVRNDWVMEQANIIEDVQYHFKSIHSIYGLYGSSSV